LLTLNVPFQIGKCTPRDTCTPGWEPPVDIITALYFSRSIMLIEIIGFQITSLKYILSYFYINYFPRELLARSVPTINVLPVVS